MLRFWMASTRTALTHASNSITPAFLYCRAKEGKRREDGSAVPRGSKDARSRQPLPPRGQNLCVKMSITYGGEEVGGMEEIYACAFLQQTQLQ